MLELKNLENRVYEGKNCVEFTYFLRDEKGNKLQRFSFFRDEVDEKKWTMRVLIDRTGDADSQLYNFTYIIQSPKAPLNLVCAVGLKYFVLYLREEIQTKSDYDFLISDVIRGM